ncbi:MAG TPA: M28 family peptidase [Thermoanaerobaculia bacterium]|nr:M28 family peptidase [Thermoanaerobaculia bacterium]
MLRSLSTVALLIALILPSASAQPAASPLLDVLAQIDGARMKATVEKLVSFGTRHTLSDTRSDTRGIGAARRWVFDEMSRYAAASEGRMAVSYQSSMQQSARTGGQPVEIVNVMAVIRGASDPNRVYIASGHLDSRNSDANDAIGDAPGADDDGSGTAVVMELARVLSKVPMDATVVLVVVSGEEQGLLGARGLADYAAAQKWDVQGMTTNDIVGGVEGGSGTVDNQTLRIFSANQKGVGDSTSRHYARFVRDGVRTYLPNVKPRLVYRLDRFGRGGDHIPFFEKGYPAIRFVEASENYRRQHQNVRTENGVEYGDLAKYVTPQYLRLSASVNAVTLYTAAIAPGAPKSLKVAGAVTDDTTLTWDMGTDADLAGYEVLVRETTSDEWEKVVSIGKVSTYTLKNYPIDNVYLGVRAVDKDGHRSPVRTPDER